MRKLLVVLLAFMVLSSTTIEAVSWVKPTTKVQASIVRLSMSMYNEMFDRWYPSFCTGEVIDNKRDYVLSAAHCNGRDITVDGLATEVVWESKADDLIVLHVAGINKPAIQVSRKVMRLGDEMATLGYGYGFTVPLFRHMYVAQIRLDLSEFELSGTYLTTDNSYIGGMSGGPVYDSDGRMVGIVQMSDNDTGLGRTIGDVLMRTSAYWERR